MEIDVPLDVLTRTAARMGAADLFLSAGEVPRVRLGGRLRELDAPAPSAEDLAALRAACGIPGDPFGEADASHVDGAGNRFRVNFFHHLGRAAAVLRFIKSEIPGLAELGLPAWLLEDWVSRRSGLVLVTGATGSGKSTTLAAALDWVNQHHSRHIVTIEDPVEYVFTNREAYFSQRQVGADTESFAAGLRAALRQSPDVIFVGEIRDVETATTALQAAETGHLVLSTLHSSSVTDTMERLSNLFPVAERESAMMLLASHLIGVISQKLLAAKEGGMGVVVEHFQNEGATREWIRKTDLPLLQDHLDRSQSPANQSFLASLVAAVRAGWLDASLGAAAAANAADFQRALRGIV